MAEPSNQNLINVCWQNTGCQKPDATSRCVLAGGETDTVNLSSICIPYITKFVDCKLKCIHLYKQSGHRFTLILPVFRFFIWDSRLPLGWIAMIYSCLLSRAIVKVSKNTNSSWPDDVYMCHWKQQYFSYGTCIEWNRYVILKFSSQPASKVVSCDAHMRTRFPFPHIN